MTAQAGIDFRHDSGARGRHHYPESMGPGLALFDADGDGDLDLYVASGRVLPLSMPADRVGGGRLYLNRGDGRFEAAPENAGIVADGYGMGAAVSDVDGDGLLDLYLLDYGPNRFYRNLGGGRFESRPIGAEDPAWSVSAAFLDADRDGDLDLYVANYVEHEAATESPCHAGQLEIYCSPEQFEPSADRLYRNDGGRFVDVSAASGIAVARGRGMGVVAADFDLDGWTDLFVANDRTANFAWNNLGGRFEDTALSAGAAYGSDGQAEGSMGLVADFLIDSDRPSLFVTNFQHEPNRLLILRRGFWDDRGPAAGLGPVTRERVAWGAVAFDLEGDGDLDLAVANGHVFENAAAFVPGSSWEMPDDLFVQTSPGRFERHALPGPPRASRGLVAGDLDGDGDEDLVSAAWDGPITVLRNVAGRSEGFLTLELATAADPLGRGAMLSAEIDGRTIRRVVASGGSYASHSGAVLHLGLGRAAQVDRLSVRWPDGSSEQAGPLAPGRYRWTQGQPPQPAWQTR